MTVTYYISYLAFNLAVALFITGLFAASGAVLLKAIVRCSTEVPLATVRILALVYGALAIGRVFLNIQPSTKTPDVEQLLFRLSETTGANLMFFAILAGFGIVAILLAARPVITLMVDLDEKQEIVNPF